MTEPTTIRQDLEGIRDTARDGEDIENVAELHFLLACIREDAVAALALLAAMEDDLATQRDRADEWKRRYEFMESHPSYVPDPAPRGDAAVIS
jgi:hypothetical protein